MTDDDRNRRTIPAGEFKNRCLALMDEVNMTGVEIVITKYGKPVSRLVPPERPTSDIVGRYRDEVRIVGDIVSPVVPAEHWEAISNPDRVLDPCSSPHR